MNADEIASAIRDAFGVSKSSPAFLEAIAMQLGMDACGGSQSLPAAICEAGERQAEAISEVAESINRLAAAIERIAK